ncbi:DNA-binding transcriptional regulator, LysR family [Beijerinckia sp. 28-YEA-48]|nr:DNA-binding transcriptional regulator, LysR family [Beijerinckia sp. 28-YEA-48]
MDFRQVQYFTAAVEQRSMSAAAAACQVTQPTLSTQIRQLEIELNDVLFGRTPIGLRPTKSAQRLYRKVSPLLDAAMHGLHYVRAAETAPIRTLRVQIPYSAASLLMRACRQAGQALAVKAPQIRTTYFPSEIGPAPRDELIQIDHDIDLAGDGTAISDQWLLISIGGPAQDRRAQPRVETLDGDINLPALPLRVREALKKWPIGGEYVFHHHAEDADELIAVLLAQNSGRILAPRLAINPRILQHPRLLVRDVTKVLPPLRLTITCDDQGRPEQRAYCAVLKAQIVKAKRNPEETSETQAPPETRQLRYFLRAFEEGSMTRVAAKLNVVQPAVSMQIRTLEQSLGGTLFTRTSQGIHPTALAYTVREIYAPILEALRQEGRNPTAKPLRARTTLRVGVLPGLDEDSLLVRAMTATILQWQKAFANVELKIVESHSGVLLDWLAENVVDIAIVEDLHTHTALKETVLFAEPLSILTAAGQSICPTGPIKMADIGKLDLVLPSQRHGLRALLDRKFADAGLPLVPKLELDSMAAAIRLVKSGGWATAMPASAVRRSLETQVLEAHAIVRPSILRQLRAVRLSRHQNRPWEGKFSDLLRAQLAQLTSV